MDDRDWGAPVTLTGNAPVAQTVGGLFLAQFLGVQVGGNGIDGIDVDEMIRYVKYRANKMAGMLGIETLYANTTDNVMPWIKAYADNFTETKTDFFEMRNASYKKTNVDNGFDDL